MPSIFTRSLCLDLSASGCWWEAGQTSFAQIVPGQDGLEAARADHAATQPFLVHAAVAKYPDETNLGKEWVWFSGPGPSCGEAKHPSFLNLASLRESLLVGQLPGIFMKKIFLNNSYR